MRGGGEGGTLWGDWECKERDRELVMKKCVKCLLFAVQCLMELFWAASFHGVQIWLSCSELLVDINIS